MKIDVAYFSDRGGREKNDDAFRVVNDGQKLFAFVGDGLGGYADGRVASETAADVMVKTWKVQDFLSKEELEKAVFEADMAVKEKQKEQYGDMKTTLVALTIHQNQARWAHVGDSRLYHFQNGVLLEQTLDHSVSQIAVLLEEIRQEDIRFHVDRNKVLRALGSDNAKPDVSDVKNLYGAEAFLLCSDGFWEYVYENEMEDCLKNTKSAEEWLCAMKTYVYNRVPQNHDNLTAVAVIYK